jgi:DNA polymerase-1
LEWDKSKGNPPFPLLKDKYGELRKKAKTMNFSIAYGKTAIGFAQDWNCSIDEAEVFYLFKENNKCLV